jgi:CO dehydrogenase/acetyl-CoA synthase gamma subunit (corrinoid Fe-S protein)
LNNASRIGGSGGLFAYRFLLFTEAYMAIEMQATLTKNELKAVVQEAVQTAFKQHIEHCHLYGVGISEHEHRQHHLLFREFLKNWNNIRTTFLITVVTGIGGSILGLIWLGFQAKTGGGG